MIRRRTFVLRVLPAALAAATLSGCGLLPKPRPLPLQFTLDGEEGAAPPAAAPAAPASPTSAASDITLVVDVPRPAAGHDGQLMAYQRQPQQLEYYASHQWIAPPAQMLAPLIVRALQDAGAFRAVAQAPTAAAGQWRLETSSLRLWQDFEHGAPSQTRLSLRAVLVETATRRVLATRDFAVQAAAPAEGPAGGAAAARTAVRELLAQMRSFCLQTVQATQAAQPPKVAQPAPARSR